MAAGYNFEDLLKQIPVGDIAERLGVDSDEAEVAVHNALPRLLGGLAVNAQSDSGAADLQNALTKHRTDGSLPPLEAIDVDDGKKIVNHALGATSYEHIEAVPEGGAERLSHIVSRVLPMVAPLVMSFLANGLGTQQSAQKSSGGIGDFLGGLLGSGSGGSGRSGDTGGLGGILGSYFGDE